MHVTDFAEFQRQYMTPKVVPVASASQGGSRQYGGGSNFSGDKYQQGLSASGRSVTLDHCRLRRNARDMYHDSVACRTVIDRMADIVVETGLFLNPTPKASILGITPEQAEEWASDVKPRFHCWFADKRCMRDETMTGYQFQRLLEISQQRDNDCFVRLHYSKDKNLLSPLQLQLIDPDTINGNGYTYTDGYQDYIDGIKRDAAGKEIAYSLISMVDGEYKPISVPAIGGRSGRRLMLHMYNPEYAGQGRGYSRLSHALQGFENLEDYELAEVKKAIIHASITMTTESSTDRAPSSPFEGISHNLPAGPAAYDTAVDPDDTTGCGYSYNQIPEATFERPGVGVFNLQGNEKLVPFKSTAPADSYSTFVKEFFTHLCASLSMPVEVILGKFSDNYSASRASLVLAWRVASIWRAELEADALNPIYLAWLSEEVAAGRISATGWGDPRLRAAWLGCEWIGAPLPSIDPLKEIKAKKEAATIGITDLDREAINHNGSSGTANRARLKKQFGEITLAPWEQQKGGPNG